MSNYEKCGVLLIKIKYGIGWPDDQYNFFSFMIATTDLLNTDHRQRRRTIRKIKKGQFNTTYKHNKPIDNIKVALNYKSYLQGGLTPFDMFKLEFSKAISTYEFVNT